jgi:hypothetical protein
MDLQQLRARLVMLIVGVDIGVERASVDDERWSATSLRGISSMRSEMSWRPLRPAARAVRTRCP